NAGFGLAENTYDLFVGKTLLHGDVLMWLMKTLLTSRCINQRGVGHFIWVFTAQNLRLCTVSVLDMRNPAKKSIKQQIKQFVTPRLIC
ncbi:hypothetical protein, partial [Raoultella ornithinolytica]|uniref:hypothetical protein n=1 Tax=Raoultella ornithinolytica TaxID=54291 RepID=UPI00196792BA